MVNAVMTVTDIVVAGTTEVVIGVVVVTAVGVVVVIAVTCMCQNYKTASLSPKESRLSRKTYQGGAESGGEDRDSCRRCWNR